MQKSMMKVGSMLVVHVDLKPMLVKEYCDEIELLVVKISSEDTCIKDMTGYGFPRKLGGGKKDPFL